MDEANATIRSWWLTAVLLLAPTGVWALDAGVHTAPSAVPDKGIADAGVPLAEPDEPVAPAIPADRMPTLSLEVTPKAVSVGEVVHWKLTVKRRSEDRIHLGSGASFGGLEIKEKTKAEKVLDGAWTEETLDVSLIGFEAEDVVIPPQKITAVDKDGNLAELMTKEAQVTVKSFIANEPEPALKEDAGLGEEVLEDDYLLLWIMGIIGAAALVALLTLVIRRLWAMRRPKSEPPPPPPRPAEEIALEKLEALKRSSLLAEGEIKEFHVRLSEAIREYLGNRYHFDSLELSSEELITALRRKHLSREELNLVLDFLGETDLVKFAKALPSIGVSEDMLAESFRFVAQTTPKTTAANGEPAGEAAPQQKEGDRA